MVDQGAALVLTSVEQATRLRIPAERWVYPHAGTDAYDTPSIAERDELHRSAAIRIAGARVLELAGLGVDDVDYLDLYSCFPSAVQVAAAELGLSVDDASRPLTVTGGLTFAGGPWSNYVMHSVATMAELLVANPGRRGLITANGGYLTKHSFGVYSTEPPAEFRWEELQSAVDREPTRDGWSSGKVSAPSRHGRHLSTAMGNRKRCSWRYAHPTDRAPWRWPPMALRPTHRCVKTSVAPRLPSPGTAARRCSSPAKRHHTRSVRR
jgi:hypothetical protein